LIFFADFAIRIFFPNFSFLKKIAKISHNDDMYLIRFTRIDEIQSQRTQIITSDRTRDMPLLLRLYDNVNV
jgi:hypothetical protein